ncbi:MAG: 4Fe-4S dicluster domain-containing protein, partial [Deltaproteobacteria bacterium]|nr:4Fe-4S dicluster domain-containing protein [Deltaproteobacteria bacterium]
MGSFDHTVLKAWPVPTLASLTFDGRPAPGLKPGRPVSAGQLLAISREALVGDLRAPFSGTVAALAHGRIDLAYGQGLSGQTPKPIDILSPEGPELAQALKSLGLDLPTRAPLKEPVLISALSPEPGLNLAKALWLDQKPTLSRGLNLLAKLWPETQFIEVLPPKFEPLGPNRFIRFKDPFPLTLPSFLRFKILGLKKPSATGVLGPEILWAMGTVARSGLPLTLIPITVQGFHYLVPPGLKLENVLDTVNLKPMLGDVALLGGLVTGRPTARLERGLKAADLALSLIRANRLPRPPARCRLCSLCRLACPLNLPINLIAQAPLENWPMILDSDKGALYGCGGCGACALACPSRRPLLLLARLSGASDPYGREGVFKAGHTDSQSLGPNYRSE